MSGADRLHLEDTLKTIKHLHSEIVCTKHVGCGGIGVCQGCGKDWPCVTWAVADDALQA